MPSARQLVVTLPDEMAELVRRKVASGEYVDESAVIADSLALLEDREQGVDQWLVEEVGPAYDAMHADPSRGIPLSHVQQEFAERRKAGNDPNR